MTDPTLRLPEVEALTEGHWIDAVCDQYERELASSRTSRLKAYLQASPQDRQERLIVELLLIEWEVLGPRTQVVSPQTECQDFPQWAESIQKAWQSFQQPSSGRSDAAVAA